MNDSICSLPSLPRRKSRVRISSSAPIAFFKRPLSNGAFFNANSLLPHVEANSYTWLPHNGWKIGQTPSIQHAFYECSDGSGHLRGVSPDDSGHLSQLLPRFQVEENPVVPSHPIIAIPVHPMGGGSRSLAEGVIVLLSLSTGLDPPLFEGL